MQDLKNYLFGVAVGVKFRTNFSIEDNLGSIADTLLFGKDGGILNRITFPNHTSDISSSQMSLFNNDTRDSLTINANNIILDVNFSEIIPKEKSHDLIEEYFKTLTDKIYDIVNIRDVRMIGLVHKYVIDDESSASIIYKKFKEITFDDATSITVNFSKKNILPEAKVLKNYNDYENVICTLSMKDNERGMYFFQVDYQHYFNPLLDSIIDIKYKDFVKKVIDYNNNTIQKWIKNHEK